MEEKRAGVDADEYKHVLTIVSYVNRNKYTTHVKTGMMKFSEAFKATEEAFGLLQLLNNAERWMQEIDGNLTEGEANHVKPRWTSPGTRGTAWSIDGLRRFNEILAEVKADRCSEEGVAFETELQDELSHASSSRKRRRSAPAAEAEVIEVSDDLGDLVGQATVAQAAV